MNTPSGREAAIFSAVRRLPVGQRAAYLDEMCGGDALLRQRVEELLKADDAAGAFLKELATGTQEAVASPGPSGTIRIATNPLEQAGDRIGRYKLLEKVGEGGCGVVYVAEQTEPVRRRVALKVIKLGMDTKAGRRPVRGGAAGAGDDGSSQHRQGAGCGHDRRRAGPIS